MSYRIMPPGSYLLWRIGSMNPIVRWVITIGISLALILSWYLLTTRFLFTTPKDQLWCTQCTAQLAELATAEDVAIAANATPAHHPSLTVLQLCEQHSVAVQSSTCQKPITKNNLSLQRVNLTCSGTLAQLHSFFTALAASTIPIAHLEAHLTQQQNKNYSCILNYDCIFCS